MAVRRWLQICAAVSSAAAALAAELPRGRLLEKVGCAKEPAQAYALYVPSHYDPARAWPVVFCFDPEARGTVPVVRLQVAAEKYGYIVAGSLNSRNGPWDANVAAIQAMVGDVDAHLHLDANRVYAAGLSGGARVASQLAMAGLAKGVLACSAGFPQSQTPERVPFVFFGTAGTEDFNYAEIQRVDRELTERGATHRTVVFDGGHEWAPAAVLEEAVGWLELQAMRAGARPRDDAILQALWRERLAAIPTAPPVAVWRANVALASDFKGLAEAAEYERRAKTLGESSAVRDALAAEQALAEREGQLSASLSELTRAGRLAEMRQLAGGLRSQAEAPADSVERRMARRVMAGAAMSVREGVRGRLDRHDYRAAASMLEQEVALRPEQSRNYFELAQACALDGDPKRALEALKQAAEKGFSDAATVEDETAFVQLKANPAWTALLVKIRTNSASPAPPSPEHP